MTPLLKKRDLVRSLAPLYDARQPYRRVPTGSEGYVIQRELTEDKLFIVKVRFLINDQTVDVWVNERAVEKV